MGADREPLCDDRGARYLGRPDPPGAKPVTLGGPTVQVKAADPDAPVPSVAVTVTS